MGSTDEGTQQSELEEAKKDLAKLRARIAVLEGRLKEAADEDLRLTPKAETKPLFGGKR